MEVEVRLGEECEVAHLRSLAARRTGGSRDRDTPHSSHNLVSLRWCARGPLDILRSAMPQIAEMTYLPDLRQTPVNK
ncbi:hypothetical protein GCM10010102_41410 [Promicromonospora citrea]|uniref:Uncharacterized protein n=1 Tax=Promicromonospora citrea TaxID=43677 RepID=A0A8H9GNG2_9MICO|nr:hypothetical protein GCM10010102_41410 [Promicromonospora citrea]